MANARQQQILNQIRSESVVIRKQMILALVSGGTNIRESGNLIQELKANTQIRRDKKGIPFKLAYVIPTYGIYRAVGVGEGTKKNQVGSTNRKPLDWYNSILDINTSKIADLFLEYHAEELMEAAQI